jgi:hypothetical protein
MINTDKIYKTMMTWKDQQVTDNSTDEWQSKRFTLRMFNKMMTPSILIIL